MSRPIVLCYLIVSATLGLGPASAQPTSTRYLSFSEGTLGRDIAVAVDGVLKLTMSGTQVKSANLDLCFPVWRFSTRVDRIVLPLQLKGNVFTGNVTSADGTATSVRIRRTVDQEVSTIEGEVIRPGLRVALAGSGLELSEDDPLSGISDDDAVEPSPVTLPDEIDVNVTLKAVPDLLAFARANKLVVRGSNLIPDCTSFRRGHTQITLLASPERAPTMLPKLLAIPGVRKAAMSANLNTEHVVRYRGVKTASEVSAALGAAFQKAVSGTTLVSSESDPASGWMTVILRRTPGNLAALGLEERVTLEAIVGPDKEPGHFVIHLRGLEAQLIDPRSQSLLESDSVEGEGEGTSQSGDLNTGEALAALADVLAADLNGDRIVDDKWAPVKR